MTDHRDSRHYHCTHVAPRGHRCTQTIYVIGPESTHFAALARVDWFLRGGGDVYCRRHAPQHGAPPAIDPLTVDCSHCLATAGFSCHVPGVRGKDVKPHASRRSLAIAVRERDGQLP